MTKSGYLLINKPKDWTSFDVVKKVQNILKTKKIGHTGTLDPFATGLLILLINNATSLSQHLVGWDKEYVVKGKFGEMTDTGDSTGNVVKSESPNPISRKDFEKIIPQILELKKQVPSKYSAIKVNGQRAYKLARAGKEFEMTERDIEIKEFQLLDFDFPYFTYKTLVSKGTYVRTLTEQIASMLGNIAVSVELERTKIGHFDVQDSITITEVTPETAILAIEGLTKYGIMRL